MAFRNLQSGISHRPWHSLPWQVVHGMTKIVKSPPTPKGSSEQG